MTKTFDTDLLPAYRFGWVIRLQAAEVDAYIEARRIKPGELSNLYSTDVEKYGRDGAAT